MSSPSNKSGPKPSWAVALDRMRDRDGKQCVGAVELTSSEAYAFVQHYLDTSAALSEQEKELAELAELRADMAQFLAMWDRDVIGKDLVPGETHRTLLARSVELSGRVQTLEAIREAAWTVVQARQPMLLGTVEDDLYRALCEHDFAAAAVSTGKEPE